MHCGRLEEAKISRTNPCQPCAHQPRSWRRGGSAGSRDKDGHGWMRGRIFQFGNAPMAFCHGAMYATAVDGKAGRHVNPFSRYSSKGEETAVFLWTPGHLVFWQKFEVIIPSCFTEYHGAVGKYECIISKSIPSCRRATSSRSSLLVHGQ